MHKSDQVPAAMLLRACYALDSIMPRAPVPVTFGMIFYVFISCMSCRGQYTLSVLAVKICWQAVPHSSTPSQEGVLLVTSHTRFVLCRPSSRHLGAYAAAFNFQPLNPVSCIRDLDSTVTRTVWLEHGPDFQVQPHTGRIPSPTSASCPASPNSPMLSFI